MFDSVVGIYHRIDNKVITKVNWSIYELLILCGCICVGILMVVRCFFGTELTDEAYYVADAKAMLEGNLPYAYCTYSFGSGSCFLLIPFIALYRIFQPELAGVFLYSRLCFVCMWYLILFLIYRILCKNVARSHALLFCWILIPFKAGSVLFNFSYNTVPCVLMLLIAFLMYDALENRSKYDVVEIIISGFISGIAFFAQPGYSLGIAVFGIILLARSQGAKAKVRNIVAYVIGGIIEICIVFVPIIAQVGIKTMWSGISRYFNGYPSNTTMSSTTPLERTVNLIVEFRQFIIVFIILLTVIAVLSKRYVRENECKLSQREYKLVGIASAGGLLVCSFLKSSTHSDSISYMLGMIGTIVFCSLLILKAHQKQIILLYVGLYPILFAVVEAIIVDSGNTVGRFTAVVPTFAICLLILMEEQSEVIRIFATATGVLCVLELGLGVVTYVYRDDALSQLQYRVEDGVYKGIYTTSTRAHDLVEVETYLNCYIDEEEYYEFHDLAPYGYLMMHMGKPCSIATWDTLNYSYGKNAPAELYEYYRRRQAIPDKIFYVDSGEGVSVKDSEFLYNEFVEAYYEKVDETELNDTFWRVIIYEYSGGFDGDYDYWIDKHMVMNKD